MTEETEKYYTENADEWSEKYGKVHKGLKPYLEKFMDLVREGKVLDAGCGPGKYTEFFAKNGFKATGIDSAPGMIEKARENEKGRYREEDVRDLNFPDEVFDGIWCNTVMQFLQPEEMTEALEEFYRVLKPEGILYITFKLREGREENIHVREADGLERHLLEKEEIKRMLEKKDFEVLKFNISREVQDTPVANIFCRKKK
jgi:ubiquinone/menaquinone biosynthesis C-methylase UbiE